MLKAAIRKTYKQAEQRYILQHNKLLLDLARLKKHCFVRSKIEWIVKHFWKMIKAH